MQQGVMVRAAMLMAALCRCHHRRRRHALLQQWSLPLVEEVEVVVAVAVAWRHA